MKATARIVAEADGRGGTRLTALYGEAPLLPRQTGPGEVHLVGGAAGPLGGDDLTLELHVAAGARLVLRTAAASIALPGAGASRTRIIATVRGRLEWLPEPVVAAHRCDHLVESTVELYGPACLLWREELICGRHGEHSGDLSGRTTVRRDDRTLYRHDLAVGPRAPAWDGPAVVGGARAIGVLLVVGGADLRGAGTIRSHGPGCRRATMPIGAHASVTTAVAQGAHQLRAALDEVVAD